MEFPRIQFVFRQAKRPVKNEEKVEIKSEDDETAPAPTSKDVQRKPKVMTEEKQKMLRTEKVSDSMEWHWADIK